MQAVSATGQLMSKKGESAALDKPTKVNRLEGH